MKETIKKSIVGGLVFSFTVMIVGVTYAAYEALTNVNSGETFTSSFFNKVLENQRTFRSEINNLNSEVLEAAPIGFVGAFNLSSCPPGWIPANGTNGTPDLRGEFIRGLDSGRGVDSGRGLATYQAGTKITGETGDYLSANGHTIHNINQVYGDPVYETDFGKYVQYSSTNLPLAESASWWKTVRPRNVALLYCVKN